MSTSTAVGYDPMAPARTTGTSITIDALAFKQAITTVKPALMKEPKVPAMGALLLQVSDYQGYLTATSLDLELDVAGLQAAMAGRAWNASEAEQLLDEDPRAYKDISAVMANQTDLVAVEHRLHQVLNYKGTK